MAKNYNIIITEAAEINLNEIVLYIAQNDIQIAKKIFKRIKEKIFALSVFPERGRIIPELLGQNIKEYREIIESPWRIIYKIEENKVIILVILDGRRNIQDLLTKILLRQCWLESI